jgi:uncharacterized membrane protein YqgA involved in biofilm formation
MLHLLFHLHITMAQKPKWDHCWKAAGCVIVGKIYARLKGGGFEKGTPLCHTLIESGDDSGKAMRVKFQLPCGLEIRNRPPSLRRHRQRRYGERVAPLLGTIVNTLAIIAGSLLGLLFRGGIPEKYSRTVMHAIGLAVVLIGIKTAIQTDAILVVIVSLAIGSIVGELLRIEDRLEHVGNWIGRRLAGHGQGVAQGFVSASLLYCVGAMAIVGSMESGLTGNHQILYAKSMLDGISSVLFASTLGIGVLFSAGSVLLYQGVITLGAASLKQFLVPEIVSQMSAVGGLLIVAIGLGLLEIRKVKVGNMLPAIFLPLAYQVLKHFWG